MPDSIAVATVPSVVVIEGEAGAVIARARRAAISYTPDLGEHICTLYAEGWPLGEILGLDGFPSKGSFQRWLTDKAGFREAFEAARRVRALIKEDEAEAVLGEDPGTMAEVAWASKRFDGQMKLAEVKDPTRYGKKVTVGGDADRPIVFKLITGVPAPSRAHIELNADGTIKTPLPDIEVSPASSTDRAPTPAALSEIAGSTPAPGTTP